jgi:uncharacterized protein GlcG (DUF336 family)
MRNTILSTLAICAAVLFTTYAKAQGGPPSYGEPINFEQAKKATEAAMAEAKKNNWAMAITVVGPSGDLVHFAKMDNTQYGSIAISQRKARAAAIFRRPTKSFEDRVAQGGAGIAAMTLDGIIASEGGIPVVIGGKIVGAIGCSGATGAQDGQACQAGVNALK